MISYEDHQGNSLHWSHIFVVHALFNAVIVLYIASNKNPPKRKRDDGWQFSSSPPEEEANLRRFSLHLSNAFPADTLLDSWNKRENACWIINDITNCDLCANGECVSKRPMDLFGRVNSFRSRVPHDQLYFFDKTRKRFVSVPSDCGNRRPQDSHEHQGALADVTTISKFNYSFRWVLISNLCRITSKRRDRRNPTH